MNISEIIKAFEELYEGDPWYGENMQSVLAGIGVASVHKRPINGAHSVYELTEHILAWREFLLKRLQGDNNYQLEQNGKGDWRESNSPEAGNWTSLLEKLEENQQAILTALSRASESLLEKQVAQRDYNFACLLNGVVQHDIYHLGQIAQLGKALGK